MTEEEFWQLVGRVRGPGGDDEHAARLRDQLRFLPLAEVSSFHLHFERARSRAAVGEVWAAGVLLNGGHGTDDGFEYFRNWLISRGKKAFERALAKPDSLANEAVFIDDSGPSAEFEAYGYVARDVYEQLAGQDLLTESQSEEAGFDDSQYSNEVLRRKLPRLWKKFGHFKVRSDQSIAASVAPESVHIPGLGEVKPGDALNHRHFGVGTVKKLVSGQPPLVVFTVNGEDHPTILSSELFSWP